MWQPSKPPNLSIYLLSIAALFTVHGTVHRSLVTHRGSTINGDLND
ncbi:hypothetical protein SLEP1_g31581 [Rubroshorea leprosula]|uniref:Uncharacterized protein n=1 Tax=Rubroshorea leprosula TaxID=152421 RepID=A0AAV5K9H1_9ROSI|nr:hypothetical protein SLEP1_g31581 [Rubroshorea leprosula]